jgi:hypothetical protein
MPRRNPTTDENDDKKLDEIITNMYLFIIHLDTMTSFTVDKNDKKQI